MIRSLLRRLRFPVLILACSGCASLSAADREKLARDALDAAVKACADYEGSGGKKNTELETACLGLKVGTAVIDEAGGAK